MDSRPKKGENARKDCQLLKEHVKYCTTQYNIPYKSKGGIMQFTSTRKQLEASFVACQDLKDASDFKTGIVPSTESHMVLSEKRQKSWKRKKRSLEKNLSIKFMKLSRIGLWGDSSIDVSIYKRQLTIFWGVGVQNP